MTRLKWGDAKPTCKPKHYENEYTAATKHYLLKLEPQEQNIGWSKAFNSLAITSLWFVHSNQGNKAAHPVQQLP
tara:strand:+ start:1042 stop:1263 length:222 start_codon:yes stop_codon:yes gene_type:complete